MADYEVIVVEELFKEQKYKKQVKWLQAPGNGEKEASPKNIKIRLRDGGTDTEVGKYDPNLNQLIWNKSGHWLGGDLTWYGLTSVFGKHEGPILDYYLISNSTKPGVVSLEHSYDVFENQTLISSGRLSGCMCFALFVRDKNKIFFYHIGQYMSNKEYTKVQMISDLVRCIMKDIDNIYDFRDSSIATLYESFCEKFGNEDWSDENKVLTNVLMFLDCKCNCNKRPIGVLYQKNETLKGSYLCTQEEDSSMNFLNVKYKTSGAMYVACSATELYIHFFSGTTSNDKILTRVEAKKIIKWQ